MGCLQVRLLLSAWSGKQHTLAHAQTYTLHLPILSTISDFRCDAHWSLWDILNCACLLLKGSTHIHPACIPADIEWKQWFFCGTYHCVLVNYTLTQLHAQLQYSLACTHFTMGAITDYCMLLNCVGGHRYWPSRSELQRTLQFLRSRYLSGGFHITIFGWLLSLGAGRYIT